MFVTIKATGSQTPHYFLKDQLGEFMVIEFTINDQGAKTIIEMSTEIYVGSPKKNEKKMVGMVGQRVGANSEMG